MLAQPRQFWRLIPNNSDTNMHGSSGHDNIHVRAQSQNEHASFSADPDRNTHAISDSAWPPLADSASDGDGNASFLEEVDMSDVILPIEPTSSDSDDSDEEAEAGSYRGPYQAQHVAVDPIDRFFYWVETPFESGSRHPARIMRSRFGSRQVRLLFLHHF